MDTIVHPRVHETHPELDDEDVVYAWENYHTGAVRVPGEREVRMGFDLQGREIEMVGVLLADGAWLICHGLTLPTKKMRTEVENLRRGV